jgi:hypothetical protein
MLAIGTSGRCAIVVLVFVRVKTPMSFQEPREASAGAESLNVKERNRGRNAESVVKMLRCKHKKEEDFEVLVVAVHE